MNESVFTLLAIVEMKCSAFTHHGTPRIGASCCTDLRGKSQSSTEPPRAGQLPVQSCVGHHAKMSRVRTSGRRQGDAESWEGGEKEGRQVEGWK